MILCSLYFSAKIFLVTDFTPGHSVSSNWSWREKKNFFSSSWMKECLCMQVVMVPIFPRKLSQLSSNRLHRVERRWGKGKDLRMFDSSILLPLTLAPPYFLQFTYMEGKSPFLFKLV